MSGDGAIKARLVGGGGYSLDDLIALNDEIVALVRSGVPLERGLLDLRGDLSGNLRRLVDAIAQRIARGESLQQALDSPDLQLPALYGAIVRAGVRGGRLAVALEQLSATARRVAEMRRIVGMAVLYPLLVAEVACSIFGFVAPKWVEMMRHAYEFHHVQMGTLASIGLTLAEWLGPVAVWLPAMMLLVVILWWWATGLARTAQPANSARWFRWVPGLGRLLRDSSSSTFCEVLALLVEHEVPLDEALRLAGATCGDRTMQAAAEALAKQIHEGGKASLADPSVKRIPAMIRWLLSSTHASRRTADAIRAAGEDYHQRAMYRIECMHIGVPILLVLLVGGSVVMLYAFTLFGPWADFIGNAARALGRY